MTKCAPIILSPFQSKKYYMKLVFHLIDMCVVNAWFLYRRDTEVTGVEKHQHLNDFKWSLNKSLMFSGKRKSNSKAKRTAKLIK